MDSQFANGQSRNGDGLVRRQVSSVGRHDGHSQAARRCGEASPRSVREAQTMTRKATSKAARPTAPEQTDDQILALFREWLADRQKLDVARPAGETQQEFDVALDANVNMTRRIFEMPATGPTGLAIKTFLMAYEIRADEEGISDLPGGLGEFQGEQYCGGNTLYLLQHALQSAATDAAQFVPELLPLVEGIVQSPVKRPAALAQKRKAEHSAERASAKADQIAKTTPKPYHSEDHRAAGLYRAMALRFYSRYVDMRGHAAFAGGDLPGHGPLLTELDADKQYQAEIEEWLFESPVSTDAVLALVELAGVIAADRLVGEVTRGPVNDERDAFHQVIALASAGG